VKARIQMGSALVMLHNTGGVTQAFGSLHRALLSSYDTSVVALLDKLDLVSREDWAKDFGSARADASNAREPHHGRARAPVL